jgi:hypothetical protein
MNFGTIDYYNAGPTGYDDIFIAKYDSSGNFLWANAAGGTSWDYGFGITTDANNNVFLTGMFESSSVNFGTNTLHTAGAYDMFIVKYDESGNVQWAKSAGGTSSDCGYSVSTDAIGNAFVAGYFDSPTITFGTDTLTNAGSGDIFIAKYTPSGNAIWAKRAGDVWDDTGTGVCTDGNGNVLLTGYFSSYTISFGATTINNPNGFSYNDVFISKLGNTTVTGIEEKFESSIFNISPNPFSTQTTLQTNIPLHNAALTVNNCFGQTVAQIKNINGKTITFNRDNLPCGLYFIRLTQDNKIFATDKLIITNN